MITWLQDTFQKHLRWLFLILLGILILTFVLTIGNQSAFTGAPSREQQEINFLGQNLASPQVQLAVSEDGQLSAMLHPERRIHGGIIQQYTFNRVAALAIADQLGIPQPSEEALRSYIQGRPLFQGPEGAFSLESYNMMLNQLTSSTRFSQSQVARVLAQDYRIARVVELKGGPGFVHPYEVERIYKENNTVFDLQVGRLQMLSFFPVVDTSEENLRAFYDENTESFRIPERIMAEALSFQADSFVAFVETPAESELRDYFRLNQFRYDTPPEVEEGEDASEVEFTPVTYEEVSEQVLNDWRREEATQMAREVAEEFTLQLWEQQIEYGTQVYQNLINQQPVQVLELEPYAPGNPPNVAGIPRREIVGVFEPNYNGRYFSELIQTEAGAALMIYKGTQPSFIPAFEDVQTEVRSRYSMQERQRQLVDKGEELRAQLQEAVDAGKSFEEACAELELTFIDPEPFSMSSPPDFFDAQAYQAIRNLERGQVSAMIPGQVSSPFYYVEYRTTPTPDENSEEFVELRDTVIEARARGDGWALMQQFTQQQLDALEVNL